MFLKKDTKFGNIFWGIFTGGMTAAGACGVYHGIGHSDGAAITASAAFMLFFGYVFFRKVQSFR